MAIIKKMHQKLQDWWRKMAESDKWLKMSRGAQKRAETFSWARGDNWRRKDKSEKKP